MQVAFPLCLSSKIDDNAKAFKAQRRIEPYIEKLALKCLDRYGNVLSPYILTEKNMKQKKNLNLIREIQSGIQLYPPQK